MPKIRLLKSWAFPLVVGLAATGIGAIGVPPARANAVALNLSCQSATPIGTIATSQTIRFDATAPSSIEPLGALGVDVVFPVGNVPASQNGGAAQVDYVRDLSYKILVPNNSRFVSTLLSGGFGYGPGTPTATLSGSPTTGFIQYTIPGPIPTEQNFQIPALRINLTASSSSGSTIQTQLGGSSFSNPGFTTTAHVTSPFNGDAATSCYQPPPNPVWTTTTIAVDTAAPVIALSTPAEGSQIPQDANVTATYNCNDGPSGSGVATCVGDIPNGAPVDTSNIGDFTFTVTSSDVKGNVSTPVTHSYSIVAGGIDATPPDIAIASPLDGAIFNSGDAVVADFACSDIASGVATCAGDAVDGATIDTSTAGAHTFTVTAQDNEGNPHARVHAYRVLPLASQQNFMSGDVTNQLPVVCDNQFQSAHKTIGVASNTAPISSATGQQFRWSLALGSDFIPTLRNGTNLLYRFAPPQNGHYVSVALTGAGSQVNGASVVIASDGSLRLSIASIVDQGTGGVGNDVFTPPPFQAVVTADGATGSNVTVRFSEFNVTTTPLGLAGPTTSKCSAGDPSYNGRVNPIVVATSLIDVTPPSVIVSSPTAVQHVQPNAALTFAYSCSDNVAVSSCTGSSTNGAVLDTSGSGPRQVWARAVDSSGNTSQQFVTYIVDDPTVDVADATAVEGPGAVLNFAVTISNPTSKVISLSYSTVDGTATTPQYFTQTAGTLNFIPGGPTTQTIAVPVANDTVFNGNRDMGLQILTNTHSVLGRAAAVGSIIDDDPPKVSANNPTATEANAAKLDFKVTLEAVPNFPVVVNYATVDGTASSPSRFAATSGSLTFDPSGPLVQHVFVPVVNDAIYNESTPINRQSMALRLTEPANDFQASGTGTITDDEASPVFVSIGSATIREGDTLPRKTMLAVTLSRQSTQTVTVSYGTVAASASVNSDYRPVAGSLVFKPGQVSKTVGVFIASDAKPENDESLSVRLGSATNALKFQSDGVVTIVDDDNPTAARVEASISDVSIVEGGAGKYTKLTFTVSLSAPTTGTVSVGYVTQIGDAVQSDFKGKVGTVSFTGKQVSKTIVILVRGDTTPEADEVMQVLLRPPSGSPVTIVKSVGIGRILNDD